MAPGTGRDKIRQFFWGEQKNKKLKKQTQKPNKKKSKK